MAQAHLVALTPPSADEVAIGCGAWLHQLAKDFDGLGEQWLSSRPKPPTSPTSTECSPRTRSRDPSSSAHSSRDRQWILPASCAPIKTSPDRAATTEVVRDTFEKLLPNALDKKAETYIKITTRVMTERAMVEEGALALDQYFGANRDKLSAELQRVMVGSEHAPHHLSPVRVPPGRRRALCRGEVRHQLPLVHARRQPRPSTRVV